MTRGLKDELKRVDSEETGFIMLMALFVIVVLFLLGTTLAVLGIQEFTLSARTKLMDQAYAMADAGVNRAAVYIQMNPSVSTSCTPGPYPTPQVAQQTETGIGGTGVVIKYTIYQDNAAGCTTNPSNKLIRATGTVTKGDNTAERTIETRIVVGAGGDEYDASFDYCIYNGFQAKTPAGSGHWPCTTGYIDINYFLGNFTIDAATPYLGHTAKGAVYTNGSIDVDTYAISNLTIKGNIVATKDITLHNAYGVGTGIKIEGNAVAGIGAAGGNASFSTEWSGTVQPMTITGYLCAQGPSYPGTGNVSVSGIAEVNFSGNSINIGYDSSPVGGIIASGDTTFDTTATVGGGIQVGNIYCAHKVDIHNAVGGGTTFRVLNSGRDSDGLGVDLDTVASAGTIAGSTIYTQGRLDATTTAAFPINITEAHTGTASAADIGGTGANISAQASTTNIGSLVSRGRVNVSTWGPVPTCGDVWAGTDSATGSGGTGFDASFTGVYISLNSLRSRGAANLVVKGFSGSCGWIWGGSDVTINWSAGLALVSETSVSAVGNVDIDWNLAVAGVSTGRISANLNVNLDLNGAGASYVDAVKSGGNFYSSINGAGWLVFHDFANSGWSAGIGNPSNNWGVNVNNDGICARGNIDMHSDVGWSTIEGDSFWGFGDGEAGGPTCSPSWWNYVDDMNYNVGGLANWSPGVPDPGLPAMPSMAADGGSFTGPAGPPRSLTTTSGYLYPTPPVVDRALALNVAGLTGEVNLLEPNWAYFKTCATQDDNDNPSVPHMIRDTGNTADGDFDSTAGNGISFRWDNSVGHQYSSNETVYAADDHNINIDLDWAGTDANFTGTIVTKGSIYVGKSGVAFSLYGSQTANMVAGIDISRSSTGLGLFYSNTCNLHLWAKRNIDLSDKVLCFGANTEFRGSFTAGNLVTYGSNAVWDNFKMYWSRWALDPVAWAPPFKVLTWKEI